MTLIKRTLVLYLWLSVCTVIAAPTGANSSATPQSMMASANSIDESLIEKRDAQEAATQKHRFLIAFYKPTYIMPFYYTGSPYNSVYQNNTPNNESLKKTEMKYQISFKVPIWKNAFARPISLYLAYSQRSYWQAYNKRAFFRETDYEPELFIADEVNFHLFKEWYLNFLNAGAVHQSNGFGNNMERSWNRLYLEAITSSNNWMVRLKPWAVIHDNSLSEHNPNIANYLGYGEIIIGYKYNEQMLSLLTHSLFDCGGKHITAELSWSFPLTHYLNGYVQIFSGYGQSLIEYNHRTNSAGIGIALSNWA